MKYYWHDISERGTIGPSWIFSRGCGLLGQMLATHADFAHLRPVGLRQLFWPASPFLRANAPNQRPFAGCATRLQSVVLRTIVNTDLAYDEHPDDAVALTVERVVGERKPLALLDVVRGIPGNNVPTMSTISGRQ